MDRQIRTIIEGESVTDRFNVHFARMGEPTWNDIAFGLALRGVVGRVNS